MLIKKYIFFSLFEKLEWFTIKEKIFKGKIFYSTSHHVVHSITSAPFVICPLNCLIRLCWKSGNIWIGQLWLKCHFIWPPELELPHCWHSVNTPQKWGGKAQKPWEKWCALADLFFFISCSGSVHAEREDEPLPYATTFSHRNLYDEHRVSSTGGTEQLLHMLQTLLYVTEVATEPLEENKWQTWQILSRS